MIKRKVAKKKVAKKKAAKKKSYNISTPRRKPSPPARVADISGD